MEKQKYLKKIPQEITIFIIALAFVILAILSRQNAYFPIDIQITQAIQSINYPWFDWLMKSLTLLVNLNISTLLVLITVSTLAVFRRYREAIFLAISTAGAFVLSQSTKILVGRVRPDPTLIRQLAKFVRNDSFPSGHVLFYIGFFGFLFFLVITLLKKGLLRRSLLIIFGLMILLIGPSRIYLGAHWFSDTLGAYLLGSLWLAALIYIYDRLKPDKKTLI